MAEERAARTSVAAIRRPACVLVLAVLVSAVLAVGVWTPAAGASWSFVPLRGMIESHCSGVAAPLPGGRVLVAGGSDKGNAEVFDSKTRWFSKLPTTMTEARIHGTAARLPGGRVLIAGGWGWAGRSRSAEVFDSKTRRFSKVRGLMTQPRQFAVAAPLPGGKVLIAGGQVPSGGPGSSTSVVNSAEVFNPKTGRFVKLPDAMTEARASAIAASLPGGRVLIAGGGNGISSSPILNSAEVFNPKTGRFSKVPGMMTQARGEAVAASLPDGRVLIAGGAIGTENTGGNGGVLPLNSAEVFDSHTGRFSKIPPTTTQAAGECAAAAPLPGGRVLIAGDGAELFEPSPP